MTEKKHKSERKAEWATCVIPALIGVLVLGAIINGFYSVIADSIRTNAQRDALVKEYESHGEPLVVKIPDQGINLCHDLLLEMKTVGFSVEVEGRDLSNGYAMGSACRWYEGTPTVTLRRS